MRTPLLLNRREGLAALAGSALAARAAFAAPDSSAAPFRYGGLDHLALSVNNTEESVRFYTRLFGNTVMKEKTNPRHYVKTGSNYIALAPRVQGQEPASINHFCPGIVDFDLAATRRALDGMGIAYRVATSVGLFVPDPDGTLVQLWTENSWAHLSETAAPASIPSQGEPLLRPTGIDHILVNVSNPEKSTEFYEKILGPVINHFCFTAPFDRGTLSKAVEVAGAKIIKGDVEAGIDFLDVNGIHIQVLPPPRV